MDRFSNSTTPNGDSLAALAILRPFLRVLYERKVIDDQDLGFILQDVHRQLEGKSGSAVVDARAIANDLQESVRRK